MAVDLEYGHVPVAGGELRCAINAHYQSALVPALPATIPTVPGLDARLSFTKAQWLASLYVDNLTNRLGVSSYSDPTNYGQFYQALVTRPRTFGLTIGYSYQGW